MINGMNEDAYEVAKKGGPHKEWYKKQLELTESQVRKAIRSFEKQIEQHQGWIRNPLTKTPDFYSFDVRRRQNLVEHHWPADIQRHKDLIAILRGVLREKGYGDK